MGDLLLLIYGILAVLVIAALVFVGLRLRASAIRVNRSLDPITQKSKTLKIEVSGLKRSRLDRQRRLDNTGSKDRNPNK
jgi:hypothetical protein